jgi:nitrogen fixation protein FixH
MKTDGWFANGLNGRHVLIGLVAFFGAMLIANGMFIYLAVATFSGSDTSDAYRKGLNYNETLEEAQRQAERGWLAEVQYDDKSGRLLLSFVEAASNSRPGRTLPSRKGWFSSHSPMWKLRQYFDQSAARSDREDSRIQVIAR